MPEGYSSSSIMLLFKAGLSGCCYGPLVVVLAQTIKVLVCVCDIFRLYMWVLWLLEC